eukprot:s267_g11.t1
MAAPANYKQVAAPESSKRVAVQASGHKWPQVAAPENSKHVAASGRKWPLQKIPSEGPQDISVLVSGTPGAELVQQYKRVEMHATAEGVDVNLVEETRKAVLSSEREYLLCP